MWQRPSYSFSKRFVASFLAFAGPAKGAEEAVHAATACCRSNATHIAWPAPIAPDGPLDIKPNRLGCSERKLVVSKDSDGCTWQTRSEAEQECMQFLRKHVMSFDEAFLETLGFPVGDDPSDGTDGLDNGLVGPSITLALNAKIDYPWTDRLEKDMFFNYVLNYANLNEARTNWRPLLAETLNLTESKVWHTYENTQNVSSVVAWVNTVLWDRLGRNGKPIVFHSGQTPLIFDPMSVIAFGYASCTGVSILLCNALRAVGVAARVAGTAEWYGNATNGNHNWVEVYNPAAGEWAFLEAAPATPGSVDTLEKNPCAHWFCTADRYPSSKVYAAKLSQDDECCCNKHHFPLAWEVNCKDVPAVDRTQYYTDICSQC